MPESHKPAFVEHPNDAEIMRAIRYLDSDLHDKGAAEDTNTVLGIFISLAIVLAGALTYIGLYIRTL